MASSRHLPRERHILTNDHYFTLVVCDAVPEELTGHHGFVTVQETSIKAHDYAASRAARLHEDDPAAWKIWLQILHDNVNRDSYEVGIATVWNVLVIADKYQLFPEHEKAKGWFTKWYDISGDPVTVDECSEAPYPCRTFDHARDFAFATMRLTYKIEGHVGEKRVEGRQVFHPRLDHRITQQLNAARGRLRTISYRDLYAPVKEMLEDEKNHCLYKEIMLWAYLKALEQTGAWPSERVSHGNSIEVIMKQINDKFKCTDPHPNGTESCFRCEGHFNIDVKKAIECTRGYFDGLCLSGKQFYKPFNVNYAKTLRQTVSTGYSSKTGDKDKDYCEYLPAKKRAFMHGFGSCYDKGCRFAHGEPSWYFSFVRSRKDFDEWKFAKGEEKY